MNALTKRVAVLEAASSQEWRELAVRLGLPFTMAWAQRLEALLIEVLPRDLSRDELARVIAGHLGVTPDALTAALAKAKEMQRARTG